MTHDAVRAVADALQENGVVAEDLNNLAREAAVTLADRLVALGLDAVVEFLLQQGLTREEILAGPHTSCARCGRDTHKIGVGVDYWCEWVCEGCFDAVVVARLPPEQ